MNGMRVVSGNSRKTCHGRASLLAGLALALLVVSVPAWSQTKTLNLSMLAGFKEDVLRANLPEFEKKTGIKVMVDAAPLGELYKKQLLALSTGGRYDVMFMDEPWIPALSEFLTPLDDILRLHQCETPSSVLADGTDLTHIELPALAGAEAGWTLEGGIVIVKARARRIAIEE